MTDIKRFYVIKNKDSNTVRGRPLGQRWFYGLSGEYLLNGYTNVIKLLNPKSELIEYADQLLSEASSDNYTFPLDDFVNRN